jgi:hypothetical protein
MMNERPCPTRLGLLEGLFVYEHAASLTPLRAVAYQGVAFPTRDHRLRGGSTPRAHSAALALALAGAALVGCGETPALCDGSDEVRWAYSQGLGGRNYEPPFLAEYGALHITIDGRCEFSLYDATLRGLRRGVINRGFAQELERDLHFGEYASFAGVEASVCLDSAGAGIADITGSVQTDCGWTGSDIPEALLDTMKRVRSLPRELDAIAERVWRPVQILPLSEPNVLPRQPVYDWNAPFDLAARAVSWVDYSNFELSAPGIPVEDDATLARLDELRATDIEAEADRGFACACVERGLFVRDTEGRIFQVLVRDEVPARLRAGPQRR